MSDRTVLAARARSSLLAGVLGEAWAGSYQGGDRDSAVGFPDDPRASDDIWLTLATCEAIVAANGAVRPAIIAETFRRFFDAGRLRHLDPTTLQALRELASGTHRALAGARGASAGGADVARRVAPLAFVLDPAIASDRALIRDVAQITHHSDEAYAGALAIVVAIRMGAMARPMPANVLELVMAQLPDTRVRSHLVELASTGDPEDFATRCGSTSHVSEAVPLALCVAVQEYPEGFDAVLRRAVSLGGDTQAIASMAFQIAGAFGCDPPWEWLRRIASVADIESSLAPFLSLLAGTRAAP